LAELWVTCSRIQPLSTSLPAVHEYCEAVSTEQSKQTQSAVCGCSRFAIITPPSMHRAVHSLRCIGQRWYQFLRAPMLCLVSHNHCSTSLSFCSCGLEPAVIKFLSAPQTSVASEQLFSAAGQIYSDRRSSLLGENGEKLLFLAYNIRLFDFKYWSLYAELMLPNDWRSEWYSRLKCDHAFIKKYIFSCICYFMLLRHLQIIIVITIKFV